MITTWGNPPPIPAPAAHQSVSSQRPHFLTPSGSTRPSLEATLSRQVTKSTHCAKASSTVFRAGTPGWNGNMKLPSYSHVSDWVARKMYFSLQATVKRVTNTVLQTIIPQVSHLHHFLPYRFTPQDKSLFIVFHKNPHFLFLGPPINSAILI